MSGDQAAMHARSARSDRRDARKKRIIFWTSAIVLAAALLLSAKPLYQWAKARRALQFVAEAETLLAAGKPNESATKYRTALQLDPLGYRPLSGAARLATRFDRPEATDLWREVMRLPECTVSDRQEYAELLLRKGRFALAEKLIDRLIQTAPDQKTLNVAAQYSSKVGNDAKAVEYARLAVARAPQGDNASRFLLSEILARSSEAPLRAEARQMLWTIAETDGGAQRSAIEALARAPDLTAEEKPRVLAALEKIPDRNVLSDLLAAELRIQLEPATKEQVYEQIAAKWGNAEPVVLAEAARWLNLNQQAEPVLALLPLERAFASEPLLLSHLDALAILQRWNEIDAVLARPDVPLDRAVVESFHARNSLGRGSPLDADLHWDRALALAGSDPSKLRFLATFAEQSHATTAAVKAYEQLARFADYAASAQRGRQRLLGDTADASVARKVAERLQAIAPDDLNAQAELTHLNLLLGIDLDANVEGARSLVTKYPTRLSFRVTAALGYLRKHDAAAALAQFQGPAPIEWPRTPPAWRAVYAATLAANGENEAARRMAATIPLEKLRLEERELLPK